jgi:DNA-binding XRE family transcriptional regulator
MLIIENKFNTLNNPKDMANRQSTPEIRTAAFIAAREKCAMSVEELAHLACLSKKQIQQIENGQSSTFYSPTVKFTAAKKIAKLIQLDEKDAFDFGPQAGLPFAQAVDSIQSELKSTGQEPLLDTKKEAPQKAAEQTDDGESKEAKKAVSKKTKAVAVPPVPSRAETKPGLVEAPMPEPSMRVHSGGREHKSSSKKWVWLLPIGALVLAIVQFQPLLQNQLDAMMGKAKPVQETALTAAPVDAAPASPPAEPASTSAAVTPPVPPAITPSPAIAVAANAACPLPDATIESYKSPSASKPGNMVFVKMPTAQIICVEDGDGKVQTKTMEPGLGYSFYGKPPFKLLTSGLSSAEVFFQGLRVRPSNADSKSMLLVQAD